MIKSNLYSKTLLKPQIPYVVNKFIYEYDLSKANISSLRQQNIIDDELYQKLYSADRMYRQVYVGNMIRDDKEIGKLIKKGIIEAKKQFFDINNIEDWEILSIKNDAIFVIGRQMNGSISQFYNFRLANTYTIFMQLVDLELYYYDRFGPDGQLDINIDIKGINDDLLPLHENGIMQIIVDTCIDIQRNTARESISKLSKLYMDYINRRLPLEYYREFDYNSKYTVVSKFSVFKFDYITKDHLPYIDINRNLSIIRSLLWIMTNLYNEEQSRLM